MKPTLNSIEFSRARITGALVTFFVTSVGYYGFFYMCRECIRFLSITTDYDIWILSIEEVFFYNTIYAAIAIIIGLGSALTFLVDTPSFLNGSVRKRTTLLNDFRVLNWVFLAWAVQLGFLFGMEFTASQEYYSFSFYPEYNYMFVLFVVVLYLQLWLNVRRMFKFSLLRIFLPVTIVYVICTFLLGSVNLIDREKLDLLVLDKNIYHNYKLEKPVSSHWTSTYKTNTKRRLFLCRSKSDPILSSPELVYKGSAIELENINDIVSEWKKRVPEYHRENFTFNLVIDRSVEMRYIEKLKTQILNSGIWRVGYVVVPEGGENNQMAHRNLVFLDMLKDHTKIDYTFADRYDLYHIQDSHGYVFINGEAVPDDKLLEEMTSMINDLGDYAFVFHYDDDMLYGDYIKIRSAMRNALVIKRNEYSKRKFGRSFEYTNREERHEIKLVYPSRIVQQFGG